MKTPEILIDYAQSIIDEPIYGNHRLTLDQLRERALMSIKDYKEAKKNSEEELRLKEALKQWMESVKNKPE
jgi:hypothetical protein